METPKSMKEEANTHLTADHEIETPVIQTIDLDTLATHIDDGIQVEFRIILEPGSNRFTYELIKSGLGDGSTIHKCTSSTYIGQLKGLSYDEIKSTQLHSDLYTKKILYLKYYKEDEGISKTIHDIINHSEIIPKYSDWLKKYGNNTDLEDPYTPSGQELIKDHKTSFMLIDQDLQIIEINRHKNKNGSIYEESKALIDAYPKEATIIQSPLLNSNIKYRIKWNSKGLNYPIITEGTIKSIIHQLENNGLILKNYNIIDKMSFILSEMRKKGFLSTDYGIQESGFHYLNNKIVAVDYDCQELPKPEDLHKSLEVLEEFGGYFKTENGDIRDKLATIFKLILITPFDYVKKQLGYDREPVFLYGAPGTAKTSLLQLPRFVYQIPKDYYIQSGGSAGTEARLAGLMVESTFPRIVDEAENIFRKPELVSLNKHALNELYSRKIRDRHQNEKTQPAYATLLYTSNESPFKHSKDGSVRRYNIIGFDETNKPSIAEKEDFQDKWKASDKGQYHDNTPLNQLKHIGQFVAYNIIKNPDLLKQNTKSLTDSLIQEMYLYAGIKPPLWLMSWTQFEDEKVYRELENDQILNFIKEKIYNAYYTRIIVSDPETGFDDNQAKLETEIDRKYDKLQIVAESDHISWLTLTNLRNGEHYIIDNGILKDLTQITGFRLNLTELSNRFNEFEYKPVSRNGKTVRVIICTKSDFERLIYPEWTEGPH